MLCAVIVCSVLCLVLTVYILMMKRQLKEVKKELRKTADDSYDRQITVSLFDKDVNELTAEINKCIENQKHLKMEAQRSENELKQSISDIAHDIRTPLSVIKGDLQLVREDAGLPERCGGYIDTCLEKAEQIKEMSDEFFDLAVIESDSTVVELSRINLTNLLMKFIADNEGLIRMSRLTPDISLPESTVFVMADEALVLRILGNLLGNVVKYSKDTFGIRLTSAGSITVSNPLGNENIPELDKLFDRTYRSDKSRNGKGAGLGLYIVKLLAQKLNAETSADINGSIISITVRFKECK